MASYTDMMWISEQPTTRKRVEYCLNKAAVAIMAEASGTANHAERVTYSISVLDGEASVKQATVAAMTNSTLTAAGDTQAPPNFGLSDNDLEFTVNSLINALAGVST